MHCRMNYCCLRACVLLASSIYLKKKTVVNGFRALRFICLCLFFPATLFLFVTSECFKLNSIQCFREMISSSVLLFMSCPVTLEEMRVNVIVYHEGNGGKTHITKETKRTRHILWTMPSTLGAFV